ncbi:unnamed protein product [Danaus chrysippus]|uniref:(African queen) hypothetical protein n=1 Tax=Danaus chrysippus TaxID=151541 RepID=A0A8J2MA10_9NEOP|nr:unnamed protein product [Danaus chrysippus]
MPKFAAAAHNKRYWTHLKFTAPPCVNRWASQQVCPPTGRGRASTAAVRRRHADTARGTHARGFYSPHRFSMYAA